MGIEWQMTPKTTMLFLYRLLVDDLLYTYLYVFGELLLYFLCNNSQDDVSIPGATQQY